MIRKSFDDISAEDFQSLIDEEVPESLTLEYKSHPPEGGHDGRKDFLQTVVSFANTRGGDIIYGIEANNKTGMPIRVSGFQIKPEIELRKLEGWSQDCIEPKVPGIRFNAVSIGEGLCVIIIRIPKSYAGPHMVRMSGNSQFYKRLDRESPPMDYREIKDAFLQTGSFEKSIGEFIRSRIQLVSEGQSILGKLASFSIIHIVPLHFTIGSERLDNEQLAKAHLAGVPRSRMGYNHQFNLDGYINYYKLDDLDCYTQVFRNCIIESVLPNITYQSVGARNKFQVSFFENSLWHQLTTAIEYFHSLGIHDDLYIFISLYGLKDAYISRRHYFPPTTHRSCDHQIVRLIDVIIESNVGLLDSTLKPALDMLWQAFGFTACPDYNDDGKLSIPQND